MPISPRVFPSTEVHTVTLPYARSSTTYTTVLRLEKATPTSQPHPHSRLSASSIGAIVGSILGLIVLLLLIYYCCVPRDIQDDDTINSDSADSPPPRKPHPQRPTGRLPEHIRRTADNQLIQVRRPRQRHRAVMNKLRPHTVSRGPSRRGEVEIVDDSG